MIGTSLAARKLPAEPPEKPHRRSVPTRKSLIKTITKQTLWKNRDGKGTTWFHPRACMLPLDPKSKDNQTTALMLLQEIGGSDYFGPCK